MTRRFLDTKQALKSYLKWGPRGGRMLAPLDLAQALNSSRRGWLQTASYFPHQIHVVLSKLAIRTLLNLEVLEKDKDNNLSITSYGKSVCTWLGICTHETVNTTIIQRYFRQGNATPRTIGVRHETCTHCGRSRSLVEGITTSWADAHIPGGETPQQAWPLDAWR